MAGMRLRLRREPQAPAPRAPWQRLHAIDDTVTDEVTAATDPMREFDETQSEDNERYADELDPCPSCGGTMTGDVCAGCGFAKPAVTAAGLSARERGNLAKQGKAMSDGSFPIRNREDLANAIQSYGRASDPEAARRWIIKRARELDAVGDLPEDWGVTAAFGRPFDESKHPRVHAGEHGGGRFTVKENDAGRFEVVNPDGTKVAETTDAADAETIKDEKNAQTAMPLPGQMDLSGNEVTYPPAPNAPAGQSEEYAQALAKANEASKRYDAALQAYRAREIGDDEYLAARRVNDAARAEFDTAMDTEAARPLALEGPYTYPSGWVGRYDPSEGKYLGLDDIYMPTDFDPTRDAGSGITRASAAEEPCEECEAIVAAIPVAPPSDWFDIPEPDEPTPLTVTADGMVYGHAALWGTCHLGNPRGPGRCVEPPVSRTNYRLFHLGEVITADGQAVDVGQITLDTGHAPLGPMSGAQTAAAHYDDTGTAVCDVRAKNGKLGVWFSGALRPDVTASVVRKLRAAKISGDWRGGELVGMLCVNVPGFPVPRTTARITASAAGLDIVDALVAAGIVGEQPVSPAEFEIRLATLTARAEGVNALVALAVGE